MRLPGVVLALAGMVAFGWGLFHLMKIGSCGGEGVPACPPDSWPYFVAVPAGMVATIVSGFLGARGLSFAGIFLTVGVASLLAAADGGSDGDTTFPLVFGLGFLAFAMLPLGLGLLGRRGRRRRQELMTAGAKGVATVLSVEDTGLTINDNPNVRLRLRVEPHGVGEPFEAEKRETVSRLAIPRPGDSYEVVYDGAQRDELHLGTLRRTPEAAAPPAATSPAQPDPGDWVAQLAQLNDLRLKGVLTDAEFASAKDKLLS